MCGISQWVGYYIEVSMYKSIDLTTARCPVANFALFPISTRSRSYYFTRAIKTSFRVLGLPEELA